MSWTKRIDRMLHNSRSKSKRHFDLFIAGLIVLSTAILFIGGFSHDEQTQPPTWIKAIDNLILVVFLLEYLARLLFVKPDLPLVVKLSPRQKFRYHVIARLRWMLSPLAIIDLLTILPLFFVSQAYSHFELFRILRILRLLRLYRLVTVYNPLEKLGRAFRDNSLLYVLACSAMGVTILMGALAFYAVEGSQNPNVNGPFDAAWWTIVTLTTVGYGDTVPSSVLGKFVAIALMLSGVILMAVFAGIMSQTMVGYLLDVREERVRMSTTVNHIIICGWNSRGPMVADELHHLAPNEEIIVFADCAEPQDLPVGSTFVRGNPTKESEWDKVRLSMAQNIVVLAPPTTGNANSITSDGYTALVVYTVRSFEAKLPQTGVHRSVKLRISAELLDPENYDHLSTAGADEVVHTAQVGSNLIAHSSLKPGMSKVVTELISWWGQGFDLEPVPVPGNGPFTFGSVSDQVRERSGCLVLGILLADGTVQLNPPDSRKITSDNKLVVIRKNQAPEEED